MLLFWLDTKGLLHGMSSETAMTGSRRTHIWILALALSFYVCMAFALARVKIPWMDQA